jgi:predicted TIM-barrel fold metal-dependent hydrolase
MNRRFIIPKGAVKPGGRIYRLFDENPNLWADLSAGSARGALQRDPQHAKEFLSRYADRLLFARDIYGGELNEFLTMLDLPTDVREKIYFKNALRLVPFPMDRK